MVFISFDYIDNNDNNKQYYMFIELKFFGYIKTYIIKKMI